MTNIIFSKRNDVNKVKKFLGNVNDVHVDANTKPTHVALTKHDKQDKLLEIKWSVR